MKYLAIDPGNEQSAWVFYDGDTKQVLRHGLETNHELLNRIYLNTWAKGEDKLELPHLLAMELIQSMGMAVGQTVFDTCIWTGRLIEAWLAQNRHNNYVYVTRRQEKLHLCGSMRAKDTNIRQAIMDRYGSTRQKAIGTKKQPGPLYGVRKDIWAAIAVAITADEGERE